MSCDEHPSLADKSPVFAMKMSAPSLKLQMLCDYERKARLAAAYAQAIQTIREMCQQEKEKAAKQE